MILVVAATAAELAGAADSETLVCGIGPVDAAVATARALAGQRPDGLLHVGIAGARRGCGLETPALVLGSEALYCDAAGSLVAARLEPDPQLLALARGAFPGAAVRPIGTSARVGGTNGCDVEGMEGFAVLRAAAAAGVPALEVRVVSNEIEEPDRSRWRFDDALAALAAALPRLVAALERR
ncbi:MAG: futalosine hydrolase [Gaiellaceae bacterium]|nr:futalosine hydrolase [Gaiellaceae bacterium]